MDKKSWTRIAIIFIFVIAVCLGIVFGTIHAKKNALNRDLEFDSGENSGELLSEDDDSKSGENVEEVYLGPNIFSGDARPIAVMIDNEKPAWQNHGGLNSAYMLYEFIIEGGVSRIMAFFKNVSPSYIGPVRSARHYFLDYAMEHDAIFVHFGWSPLAQSNIKTLGINNINGIYDTFFWRVAPKGSYHNAVTSMQNIKKFIARKNYRDTSDKECIIKYNRYDTNINSGDIANTINIKYTNVQNITYKYDSGDKVYYRSMRGQPHKDSQTGEQFYAKNIIMIFVKDELLDDPENKGRRNLYNIGTGNGYYATNGKIEKITWSKAARDAKTVYKDTLGNEITFNDGITWVQIVPITGNVKYE